MGKDKAKDEKRSKQIKKLAAKDAAKMEQGMDKKGSEISQKKAASKAQLKRMKDICINKGYRACVHKQHVSKAKIEAQYKKGGPHFGKVVPQKAIKKLAVKRKKCEKKTDFNCMKQSLKNLIDLNRKTAGDMIQKKAALMKLQKKVMPVVKELKIK